MGREFRRHVADAARRFVGVRLQQGRPQLDSDWNEAPGSGPGSVGGLVRGVVLAVDDPLNRLRLRVSLPGVSEGAEPWAEACTAPGSRALPAIGHPVWLAFEDGDPSRPVWLGVVGAEA